MKNQWRVKVNLFCVIFSMLIGCSTNSRQIVDTSPSHEIWDNLLKLHVRDGLADYQGFIQDSVLLTSYLKLLSSNAPDQKAWSKNEQLAYWINAYNAFTVKLIMDHYPTNSIRDLKTMNIPGVSTIWHRKFFKIGEVDTSLDEIEHKILRKQFDEPRIHFAINCASISCPVLRAEAYSPKNIESQLYEQAVLFINDPDRNRISTNEIELSKIFSWFKSDFTNEGSLIEYINQYSKIQIDKDANLTYLNYDWRLNETK